LPKYSRHAVKTKRKEQRRKEHIKRERKRKKWADRMGE
jgi:hypothetical protein